MDTSLPDVALVDALTELGNLIEETPDLCGLVKRGAELFGAHLRATAVTVFVRSFGHEEVCHWPEDLDGDGRAGEQLARELWDRGGGTVQEQGWHGVLLRRGPHRVGAVVARIDTPGPRQLSLFHGIANHLSLVFENALLLRLHGDGDRSVDDGQPLSEGRHVLQGETASAGFAAGKLFHWEGSFDVSSAEDVETGVDLESAFAATREQLVQLKSESARLVDDTAATIFDAHLQMISDDPFIGRIRMLVEAGEAPIAAAKHVVTQLADQFAAMDDPRFAEKAQDIRDLGMRLIRNLRGAEDPQRDYSDTIVAALQIYPSDLVALAAQKVAGMIFVGGGLTAHLSILATSLEIPAMLTQDRNLLRAPTGTMIALDTDNSSILVRPEPEEMQRMRDTTRRRRRERSDLSVLSRFHMRLEQQPGRMQPTIRANVNLFHDADRARILKADGIGLYRSEFPFIIRNDYLTEEEQYSIYRRIADTMPDSAMYFRTADIGGDKILPWNTEEEANPFLGVRGIRFSLANPDMFTDQLRAMLRAGHERDLRIMFPMVSSIDEIYAAREHLESAVTALKRDGYPFNCTPKIGAMIELPSAVIIAEELAEELDFLSIGTNDLVMYLLAVDRTNGRLEELYRSHHPIVLRTISSLVERVKPMDTELSVCGDSAADPVMLPFYLGLGVPSLSVAPDNLIRVRKYTAAIGPEIIKDVMTDMCSIRLLKDMDAYAAALRTRIEERVRDMFPVDR